MVLYFCVLYITILIRETREKKVEIVEENLEFIPSDTFRGAKEGYVFKNGDMQGYDSVGYYIDNN